MLSKPQGGAAQCPRSPLADNGAQALPTQCDSTEAAQQGRLLPLTWLKSRILSEGFGFLIFTKVLFALVPCFQMHVPWVIEALRGRRG